MFILLCSQHSFLSIELLTTSLILISFFFLLVALSLKSYARGVSINYCIVLYCSSGLMPAVRRPIDTNPGLLF